MKIKERDQFVKDVKLEAQIRDKEYNYHMGYTDALKRVLEVATEQFRNNKMNSDCFRAVNEVIDIIINKDLNNDN